MKGWAWLAVLALIATTGCYEATPQGEPIVIGTITSLTGDLEALGPYWRDSVRLVVHDANALGGVLDGRRIKLEVSDDRTNAEGGAAAATKLVELGAVGIIGAPTSDSSLAAVAISGPAKIVQISGTSTSPLLNAEGDDGDVHPYFFRTVPGDQLQGVVVGSLAFGEYNGSPGIDLSCKRLAIIYINNDYGTPFANNITNRFTALGGAEVTVVANVGYLPGLPEDQYASLVQGVLDNTPDCIAMVAYPGTGGGVVRQWYSLGGEDIPWFGTDGTRSTDFMNEIGGRAAGNFLGSAPASNPNRPQLRDFLNIYEATFGEPPQVLSENVYDAAMLLVLAIAQAGSTEPEAIVEALGDVSSFAANDENYGPGSLVDAVAAINDGIGINYEGAGGNVDMLSNGDVISDYEIWSWNPSGGDGTGGFDSLETIRADQITVE